MSDIDDILDKEDCASTYCGAPVHEPAKYERARLELAALREEVGRLRSAIDNAGNGLIRTLHDQDSVVVDGWAWRQLFETALAAKEEA